MSYDYQQQNSTQPAQRTSYYATQVNDGYGGAGASSRAGGNGVYSDRGRVFANDTAVQRSRDDRTTRNASTRAQVAAPIGNQNGGLQPYSKDRRSDTYGRDERHGRSRSHYRSDSGHRRRNQSQSSSRSRSTSRNRLERATDSTRDALDTTFDTRGKGVGAGLLGALIGGAIGKRMGDNKDSHALAGALVGGLGLNALEKHVHKQRQEKRDDREEEDEYYSSDRRRRSR